MVNMKRIVLYLLGTLVLALGNVLFVRSGLGGSAVVAVPYTLAVVTPLSLGTCSTIIFIIYVFLELLIYKSIDIKTVLQIPFSFLFGWIVDFYDFVLHIYPQHIVLKICCLLVAVCFTAIGVFLIVKVKFIVNPPDGIVQAISKKTGKEFGKVKFLFDIAMVIFALLIGIICRGEIIGIGIGTVIGVFSIGNIIRILDRHFK